MFKGMNGLAFLRTRVEMKVQLITLLHRMEVRLKLHLAQEVVLQSVAGK
jgi:hypothetical protein